MRQGEVIDGKYELVRLLGRGGMGEVWEGRHRRIGRRVALKFLKPELSSNADMVARFLREAQAAAAIGSEHIVEVTDISEPDSAEPYLVMERLEGEDLSEVLKREGPLAPERAVRYVTEACRALSAAHGRGIVHRDVKPENLFLNRREDGGERVKVLDFGIAKFRDSLAQAAPKLTSTGMAMGTPYYMAPEQAVAAAEADHRADIYSLGVVLYELLTGKLPFEASSLPELFMKLATVEPKPLREHRPDLPAALEAVVLRAMAKGRDRRPSSAAELARALEPFASPPPALAFAETAGRPSLATGTPLAWQSAELPAPSQKGRPAWQLAIVVAGLVAVSLAGAGLALRTRDGSPAGPDGPGEPPAAPSTAAAARSVEAPEPASAPAQPATVSLEVLGEPATATILVDGLEVGHGRFAGTFPRDGARHRVEVRAEGFSARSAFVLFDRDRALELALAPAPPPLEASAAERGPRPGTTRRPGSGSAGGTNAAPGAPTKGPGGAPPRESSDRGYGTRLGEPATPEYGTKL